MTIIVSFFILMIDIYQISTDAWVLKLVTKDYYSYARSAHSIGNMFGQLIGYNLLIWFDFFTNKLFFTLVIILSIILII